MLVESVPSREGFAADIAVVGFDSSVSSEVAIQITLLCEGFKANLTFERIFASVVAVADLAVV